MFRNSLKKIKFNRVKDEIMKNISKDKLTSIKTNSGNTQNSERLSTEIVKNA